MKKTGYKRLIAIVMTVLMVVGMLPTAAFAVEGMFDKFTVNVKCNEVAVKDATVTLTNDDLETPLEASSDEEGTASFEGIVKKDTAYKLSVSCVGYETYEENIDTTGNETGVIDAALVETVYIVYVTDSGNPKSAIDGVTVSLTPAEGKTEEATTKNGGLASFEGLLNYGDTYTLSIEKEGYKPVSESVTVAKLEGEATYQKEISLVGAKSNDEKTLTVKYADGEAPEPAVTVAEGVKVEYNIHDPAETVTGGGKEVDVTDSEGKYVIADTVYADQSIEWILSELPVGYKANYTYEGTTVNEIKLEREQYTVSANTNLKGANADKVAVFVKVEEKEGTKEVSLLDPDKPYTVTYTKDAAPVTVNVKVIDNNYCIDAVTYECKNADGETVKYNIAYDYPSAGKPKYKESSDPAGELSCDFVLADVKSDTVINVKLKESTQTITFDLKADKTYANAKIKNPGDEDAVGVTEIPNLEIRDSVNEEGNGSIEIEYRQKNHTVTELWVDGAEDKAFIRQDPDDSGTENNKYVLAEIPFPLLTELTEDWKAHIEIKVSLNKYNIFFCDADDTSKHLKDEDGNEITETVFYGKNKTVTLPKAESGKYIASAKVDDTAKTIDFAKDNAQITLTEVKEDTEVVVTYAAIGDAAGGTQYSVTSSGEIDRTYSVEDFEGDVFYLVNEDSAYVTIAPKEGYKISESPNGGFSDSEDDNIVISATTETAYTTPLYFLKTSDNTVTKYVPNIIVVKDTTAPTVDFENMIVKDYTVSKEDEDYGFFDAIHDFFTDPGELFSRLFGYEQNKVLQKYLYFNIDEDVVVEKYPGSGVKAAYYVAKGSDIYKGIGSNSKTSAELINYLSTNAAQLVYVDENTFNNDKDKLNLSDEDKDKIVGTYRMILPSDSVGEIEEFSENYVIYAVDYAGNISGADTGDIVIDNTLPEIINVNSDVVSVEYEAKYENDDTETVIADYITKDTEIKFEIDDLTDIVEIGFLITDNTKPLSTEEGQENPVKKSVEKISEKPQDGVFMLTLETADVQINSSVVIYAVDEGGNIGLYDFSSNLIADTTATTVSEPTVTVLTESNNPYTGNGNYYANETIALTYTVEDYGSGIGDFSKVKGTGEKTSIEYISDNTDPNADFYEIEVNGTYIGLSPSDVTYYTVFVDHSKDEAISKTVQVEGEGGAIEDKTINGKLNKVCKAIVTVYVGVKNNSGSISPAAPAVEMQNAVKFKALAIDDALKAEKEVNNIYLDTTVPVIEKFEFENGHYVEEGKDGKYDFFFKKETTVKVYASDIDGSGVDQILFARKSYIENTEIDDLSYQVSSGVLTPDENGRYSYEFTVPGNFKGNVYAYAIDNTGNECAKKTPDGVITEPQQSSEGVVGHDDYETHITATLTPAEGTVEIVDGKEQQLFNGDVKLNIEIKDTFNGIATANVLVVADGKDEPILSKELIFITETNGDNGKIYEYNQKAKEWNVTTLDANLVGSISQTFDIKAEDANYNDIKLYIRMTDSANNVSGAVGNTAEPYAVFSIDTTAPVVELKHAYEIEENPDNTERTLPVEISWRAAEANTDENYLEITTDKTTPYHNGDAAALKDGTPESAESYPVYNNKVEGATGSIRHDLIIKITERNLFDKDQLAEITANVIKNAGNIRPDDEGNKAEPENLVAVDHQKLGVNWFGPYKDVDNNGTVKRVKFVDGETLTDDAYYLAVIQGFSENPEGGTYDTLFNCTDLALNGNVIDSEEEEEQKEEKSNDVIDSFVIDTTAPAIGIVFDNNDANNENYYKKERIATISVTERNYNNPATMPLAGTAVDDEKDISATAFPNGAVGWTVNDIVSTATANFSIDAYYSGTAGDDGKSIEFTYTDLAGNESKAVIDPFYVDQTMPVITITGIEDKSANNGTIAPEIEYTDTNFDKDNVNFLLIGVNSGTANYSKTITDIKHGQKHVYDDFKHVKEVDDIYTLKVSLTDLAGNTTEKIISFSCNRFGSVFDLSKIKDYLNKYNQNEFDVVFTETNVDPIDKNNLKVKIVKNGTTSDLELGKDYTLSLLGGDGRWCRYTYSIKKSLFAEDATYSIIVDSTDKAGNINENTSEKKDAEISFGIDKTKPVVTPVDLTDKVQYAVDEKKVDINIKDNLLLAEVKVYLNDQEIQYAANGETYSFVIPKSNSKQTVRIVAVDSAGNEEDIFVRDFLVTTNIFARWFNNTPLFIVSMVVIAAGLGVGIWRFIVFKKRKED